MRMLLASGLVTLVWLAPVAAQSLLYRVPQDGVFVLFELEILSTWKGENEKKHNGTLTMSSVGEIEVDGKPSRWLEIKMEDKNGLNHIAKVLIPIERLKNGESPLDHAIKGWRKMREGEPKPIANFKTHDAGALPALLPGPMSDAKKLPKKLIDSKVGKLECVGYAGKYSFDPNNELTCDVTCETWMHDSAPFGVVSCQMKVRTFRNGEEVGTSTKTLRIIEVGKGAKSDLPDYR